MLFARISGLVRESESISPWTTLILLTAYLTIARSFYDLIAHERSQVFPAHPTLYLIDTPLNFSFSVFAVATLCAG